MTNVINKNISTGLYNSICDIMTYLMFAHSFHDIDPDTDFLETLVNIREGGTGWYEDLDYVKSLKNGTCWCGPMRYVSADFDLPVC